MDSKNLLISRYLPYAEETIVNRAIPGIDGFKPVQRRILYAMYELGLNKGGAQKKSARIVGDTMGKYHPHGDQSIYEAMCAMEAKYEGFNAPLINGQGSFGKAWSNPKLGGIAPAKMRYTEAGLAPIANELFDGIRDGAIKMIPNFDGTEEEPELLPTKYPNVLVNSNRGVAVGFSSNIPAYTLKNVCNATAMVLRGKATKPEDILNVLGAPDFPFGGIFHCDAASLMKLLTDGRATFEMTANMHQAGNDIVIDTVPAGKSFEGVMEQIKKFAQTPYGKDIEDIKNNTGLNTCGILVKVRRGANLRDIVINMLQQTDLRAPVSFLTQIIVDNRPKELGVYALIEEWIKFRSGCVQRVYTNRAEKLQKELHKKEAWRLIYDYIPQVLDIMKIAETEADARAQISSAYGLDEEQLDYLFNLRIRTICKDKANSELKEIDDLQLELQTATEISTNETKRREFIAGELDAIATKYGSDGKCVVSAPVPQELKEKQKPVIPATDCTVFITRRGLIKCLKGVAYRKDGEALLSQDDSLACAPIYSKLNGTILIYTYGGFCYKIPCVQIENTRQAFKQYFWDLVQRKDNAPVLYACDAGNYTGSFTIVYGSGRGRVVHLEGVAGNRSVYQNNFLPGTPEYGHDNTLFVVPFDRFYMISYRNKAAYGDVTAIKTMRRAAFKVARVAGSDFVTWFINADKLDESKIDRLRYCKEYAVKIDEDYFLELIRNASPFEKDKSIVLASEKAAAASEASAEQK